MRGVSVWIVAVAVVVSLAAAKSEVVVITTGDELLEVIDKGSNGAAILFDEERDVCFLPVVILLMR